MTELSGRHQKMMPRGIMSENPQECLEASCGLCLGMPQGIMHSERVKTYFVPLCSTASFQAPAGPCWSPVMNGAVGAACPS